MPGGGPTDALIAFIAEAPGADEELSGRLLVGKAGQELDNTYLFRARLDRSEIYASNVRKCRPSISNRKPKYSEAVSCAEKFLKYELDYINPRLIVLMGATACSLCDPPIELQRDHGIVTERMYLGKLRHVMPTYHPAAGMHNTTQMIPILDDFEELRKIVAGTNTDIVDQYPIKNYSEITDIGALRSLMEKTVADSPTLYPDVGMDTETDEHRLWCMTFSTADDNGFMIRATRPDLLSVFGEYASDIDAVIHNDLFDLDPLEYIANIRLYKVTDTMKMAYHQGNVPQGLKPLSWRLLRISMRGYEDVVRPYSRDKIVDWLIEAQYVADKDKIIVKTPYKKPMKRNGVLVSERVEEKTTEASKLLKRLVDNTTKPQVGENPYDPWERLNEVVYGSREKDARPELLEGVIKQIGKWPVESIVHVPYLEARDYACADANSCRRIKPVMMKRCDDIAKLVSKENWDK